MQKVRNVGIQAIEIYFPKTYVSQTEFEQFSGVSKGKYTIGLGQTNMAFVQEFEDVNSMALTVVQNLLEKFKVDPRKIGRLEVGTETLVDKSKSTKTVLMQLFSKHGNNDIEGVTSINACYGGTNALFNTINWVQSSAWDGRLGIVVTTDIAIYAKGPARPTGGAGAVAMLIGPDAPIVMEDLRSSYMDNAYDFYKPDMSSEYPTVEGQLSISSYSKAITNCYLTLKQKIKSETGQEISLDNFDFCCFHTPFCKQVSKSFSILFDLDMKLKALSGKGLDQKVQIELENHKTQTLDPKVIQSILQAYWKAKTVPTLTFSTNLGNTYTGSLYTNLIALISDQTVNLENKRVLMFSYGSGLASSMFALRFNADTRFIREIIRARERLDNRVKVPCEVYDRVMEERKNKYNQVPLKPEVQLNLLDDGTFYLESIDEKYRRTYARKTASQTPLKQNLTSAKIKDEEKAGNNNAIQRISLVKGHFSTQETMNQTEKKKEEQLNNNLLWTGFHKKTLKERLDHLKKLDPTLNTEVFETGGLNTSIADIMVENCVGKLSLPMGLGLNFQINGKFYSVPMVVEEPSVIAACSSAAKFVSENGGGFKAGATEPIMRGQMQILDCDCQNAKFIIEQNSQKIIEYANQACQSMVSRGGGVIRVKPRIIPCGNDLKMIDSHASEMLIVDISINVCESMGANIINTVVEHTTPYVAELVGGRPGIKILSNLCKDRRAFAYFEIPIENMKWKTATGEEVSKRIIEAYLFAKHDVYRGVTHNKGIMNGIDAAAVATGQDWRAIEAAAHTYSEIAHGKYQPLTQYTIKKDSEGKLFFRGSIELPISLGTVGGVVQNNPVYKNNMKILGYPNSKELSQILVCVGLANNFAALRALAVEGIQKGHMSLHAKNIALSAGVPHYLSMDAVEFMKSIGRISKDSAKAYLEAIDLYVELKAERPKEHEKVPVRPLSTFFVEISVDSLVEPIILNIALDCFSERAIHLTIEKNPKTKRTQHDLNIQKKLFGDKGYQWLSEFFVELDLIKFSNSDEKLPGRSTGKSQELSYKFKALSILTNILSNNLIKMNYEKSKQVFQIIKTNSDSEALSILLKNEDLTFRYGCCLLNELFKITQYNLELIVPYPQLKTLLLNEMFVIVESHFIVYEMWLEATRHKKFNFERFFAHRRKRLSATMMLYCDALSLKNELQEDTLQKMKVLGEVYEIEGTIARDLSRLASGENGINVYSYWLSMKGINDPVQALDANVMLQFIQFMAPLSDIKKRELDSGIADLYEVTKCVIQSHYGVNEKMLPIPQVKPKL